MPNGHDQVFRRLVFACAAYRSRFGKWPAEARMEPLMLWSLVRLFDAESFVDLATRLTLRSKDGAQLTVGGPRGVHAYHGDDAQRAGERSVELTWRWLGVTPLADRDGMD